MHITGCVAPRQALALKIWCQAVSRLTPLPLQRTRDEIIRILYEQGFQYGLILCFLVSVYGICISLSTLKRCLKRQHLKRRGNYSDLQHVGRCVMYDGRCVYVAILCPSIWCNGTEITMSSTSIFFFFFLIQQCNCTLMIILQ